MKRAILTIISFTIVIGVLALAFNNAFGQNTITFLKKEQIYFNTQVHFYIYKYDFWAYFKNIQLTTTNLSILKFDIPTRQWITDVDLTNFPQVFGNNFLVILDYIIMIINILLYPLKVGAYMLQNLLAILGVNFDTQVEENGLSWLVIFVRDILSRIQIPYL